MRGGTLLQIMLLSYTYDDDDDATTTNNRKRQSLASSNIYRVIVWTAGIISVDGFRDGKALIAIQIMEWKGHEIDLPCDLNRLSGWEKYLFILSAKLEYE